LNLVLAYMPQFCASFLCSYLALTTACL
jgi:hypothetical protein